MKRVLPLVLFALIICNVAYASDVKWEYVLTSTDVSYSVDMNSVRVTNNLLIFWAMMDDNNNQELITPCIAVNPVTREFRFEEDYVYSKKTKERKHYIKPTKWSKISPGSPIEQIVDYIIANHPGFKKTEE
ncbi:MAG: hypothetical protein E6713_05975 [Sporomusaceae bacterium]|nr:hypothetical protein [Sporomusaceae bacterium]